MLMSGLSRTCTLSGLHEMPPAAPQIASRGGTALAAGCGSFLGVVSPNAADDHPEGKHLDSDEQPEPSPVAAGRAQHERKGHESEHADVQRSYHERCLPATDRPHTQAVPT